MTESPAPSTAPRAAALAPLRHPVFRWIWISALVSHVGSFMTDVAQGWMMTTMAASPLIVALLATAESAPFFLLGLPAGALADVVDRRKLLLVTQAALVVVALGLVFVTLGGAMTPGRLLAFAFAVGVVVSLNDPAWYALPPEILPADQLAAGITLNGVGFNIARVAGPALGGILVAAIGPAAVFTIDAVSFVGVIVALAFWRRERVVTVLPAERIFSATKAGLRFARHSPPLKRVLVRVATFISCACIVMALLPVLARETTGGALAYGLLLGSLGFGAVSAAAFLDRIRARWSSDAIVTAGSIVFGVVCMAIGATRNLWILAPIFFIGGTAWISVLSTLNISAQRVSPSWVRARALAVYLLVLQAGIMGGSAAWGAVAERMDLATAYLAAGGALVLGSFLLSGVRLARGETEDLTPTHHWPDPAQIDVSPETGPVVIEVEYRIDPARAQDFVRAARELRRIRRRDGAVQWWLLRDTDEPARWVEIFAVETWGEHLRQHERVSAADRAVEDTVFAFHLGPERPKARHLLSTPLERGVTPGKFTREA